MVSFRNFVLLCVIAISLGEEVPPQALASQATKEKPENIFFSLASKGTKKRLELAASKEKLELAAQEAAAKPEVAAKPEAASVATTHAQEVQKDPPASEAPPASPALGGHDPTDGEVVATKEAPHVNNAAPHVDTAHLNYEAGGTIKDEDSGELEVVRSLPQQTNVDNTTNIPMLIPAVAALLSFAGIMCYSLVFLCKVFHTKKAAMKGQKAASKDELDLEDLENGSSSRKRIAAAPVSLHKEVVHEEPAGREISLSDDEWGNNAWENEGWDDLDDCEADLGSIDRAVSSDAMPSTPPPVKGKKGD